MIKIKTKIIYSLFTIAIIFSAMVLLEFYNEKMVANNYRTVSLKKFKEKEFSYSADKEKIYVKTAKIHISGAIKNPGFYKVPSGIKLKQIIEKYIILRTDANLSNLNLDKKIYDQDKLIIPHNKNK